MKGKKHQNAVDDAFRRFFDTYHLVAEQCSGTLALSIVQCLVMAASVVKKDQFSGLNYWLLTAVALISTVGFLACFLVMINVIIKQDTCGKWSKFLIFLLFAPVYVGIILSAVATFNSLKG